MIQLATDPNASRTSFRPADGKAQAAPNGRRSAHAWPFPSRYAARPRPEGVKPTANNSGS